jgi:hypothetical protein
MSKNRQVGDKLDIPEGPKKEEEKKEEKKSASELAAELSVAKKEIEQLTKRLDRKTAIIEANEPKDAVGIEDEIRKYVKRNGGYKKNLPEDQKKKCAHYLRKRLDLPENKDKDELRNKDEDGKVLKSPAVVWDKTILVPGRDAPSVAGYMYDPKDGQLKGK